MIDARRYDWITPAHARVEMLARGGQGHPLADPLSREHHRPMLHACPACDYALDGLPERHICPECGFAYDKKSRVLRVPRGRFDRFFKTIRPILALGLLSYFIYLMYKSPGSVEWGFWLMMLAVAVIPRTGERHRCVIAPDRIAVIGRRRVPEVALWTDVERARFNRISGGAIIRRRGGRRMKVSGSFFPTNEDAYRFIDEVNDLAGRANARCRPPGSLKPPRSVITRPRVAP